MRDGPSERLFSTLVLTTKVKCPANLVCKQHGEASVLLRAYCSRAREDGRRGWGPVFTCSFVAKILYSSRKVLDVFAQSVA